MTANIISHQKVTKLEDVTTSESVNAPSTVPAFIVQRETAIRKFRDAVAKDESLKVHIDRFLQVMAWLEHSQKTGSFDFRDAVINSRGFDGFSVEILRELFDTYVETMIALKRLSVVESCYDEPVYVFQ